MFSQISSLENTPTSTLPYMYYCTCRLGVQLFAEFSRCRLEMATTVVDRSCLSLGDLGCQDAMISIVALHAHRLRQLFLSTNFLSCRGAECIAASALVWSDDRV